MRQVLLWSCALAIAASLLVATDYRSRDPDSTLYARLSGELAEQPPSRWIAPEWRGAWNQEGLFREHPAGILLPSVLLIRAGVPAGQAAFIVNMLYQAAVIALVPLVAGVVVNGLESRSLAWILQLLPVSFVYRIRGNQEHPLLMCFLALIYGTHRARTNPWWMLLMVASFCFLVLVKGAFAMFALVGAALWLVVIPAPPGGSNRWAWSGLTAAVVAAALMLAGYEALYVRTTGESFLEFYRTTRLGGSMRLSDPRVVPHALANVGLVPHEARVVRSAVEPGGVCDGSGLASHPNAWSVRCALRRHDRTRAGVGIAVDGGVSSQCSARRTCAPSVSSSRPTSSSAPSGW